MNRKKIVMGVLGCFGVVLCFVIAGIQGKTQNISTSINNESEVLVEENEKEIEVVGSQPEVSGNNAEQVSDNCVSEEETYEEEYSNFAIADVDHYVNVRNQPTTEGEIIGKMYDGSVAEILTVVEGEGGDWFQITSGNAEGYIKAEYFIYGEDAAAVMDEYVSIYAEVIADRLNVRAGQSIDEKRIGYIDKGEKVKVTENCGEWIRVQYTEQKEGYVSAEYVMLLEEYKYAKTLEEEQIELSAKTEREKRENISSQEMPEVIENVELPAETYTSNEQLRKAVVDHAMQYVGNRYVSGGSSLAGGTDCSGFTCFVYADFGYSISRTPSGQFSGSGRSIDYSAIQPGDIICYSSNGKSCTHVGLYIGNGQIVHAANSRRGVVVQNADYDTIIGIKNVID